MPADTLSAVLGAVRLSGGMFFRVELRAPYAVTALGVEDIIASYAPGALHLMPFHLVTRGEIWFDVLGGEPVQLRTGDVVVLPHGAVHTLTDTPGRSAVPVGSLQHAIAGMPPTLRWGGNGPPSAALCGFFHCDGRIFNPLIDALPEVVVVRHDADRSDWLTLTLERTFTETLEHRPGGAALVERLTELLFIDVIQRYVEEHAVGGWLGALDDPVVGRALALLHASPDRRWSTAELANAVGASRSMLNQRFTEVVRMPPMRYLAAWRMEMAAQQLIESRESIAAIASAVGYESEAAFNRAFRRHAGEPPAAWRRALRAGGSHAPVMGEIA